MSENELLKLSIKLAIDLLANGKIKQAKDKLLEALSSTNPITETVDTAFVEQINP